MPCDHSSERLRPCAERRPLRVLCQEEAPLCFRGDTLSSAPVGAGRWVGRGSQLSCRCVGLPGRPHCVCVLAVPPTEGSGAVGGGCSLGWWGLRVCSSGPVWLEDVWALSAQVTLDNRPLGEAPSWERSMSQGRDGHGRWPGRGHSPQCRLSCTPGLPAASWCPVGRGVSGPTCPAGRSTAPSTVGRPRPRGRCSPTVQGPRQLCPPRARSPGPPAPRPARNQEGPVTACGQSPAPQGATGPSNAPHNPASR